ncbi:MAG TPA: zf-HC2 domain-containing protein [Gemmatimonadales bacterium]|jgi:anti-sigma-K factor RskA|nr:zf-HC2 domain-containing protein [Gemmatimonadales bacterium]
MTCAELRERLDAYASGTLPDREAAAFEAHLGRCAECVARLEAAAPRLEPMTTLPRAVAPAADLWPAIRSRLARRGAAGPGRIAVPGWWLAAAAALLIAVSSGVTALVLRRGGGGAPSVVPAFRPSVSLTTLEAQYSAASDDLTGALEKARARLAPETLAIIRRNLATIDSALAESRRALARDPANAALTQLVVAAWRQKLDFLRRATALSTAS